MNKLGKAAQALSKVNNKRGRPLKKLSPWEKKRLNEGAKAAEALAKKSHLRSHANMEVSPPGIRPNDPPNPILLSPTNPDRETLNPPPGKKARKKQVNSNHRVTRSSRPSRPEREKTQPEQYVADRSTPTKSRDGPWGYVRNEFDLLDNTCRSLKFSADIYRREVDVTLEEVAHARAEICHLNAELVEKDIPDDRNHVFEYLEHLSNFPDALAKGESRHVGKNFHALGLIKNGHISNVAKKDKLALR